jgi:hypothetical protein
MPGHGNRWNALYANYAEEKLARDVEEAQLICQTDCINVEGESDQMEQVFCFRWGSDRLVNQVLVVSRSEKQSNFLFSAYPVILDGMNIDVTIDRVEPWEYGIEGWIHGRVTSEETTIHFFDTMYFSGSAALREGDSVCYRLAGLAQVLQPIKERSFEIQNGEFWEHVKKQRLEEGESDEKASRPVEILRTGAAVFLPRDDIQCGTAEFQGVIETIDIFEHDKQKIYCMEMVLMRPGDEEFRLSVYASERVLDGYIPRLGDDVEGILWLQGLRPEADDGASTHSISMLLKVTNKSLIPDPPWWLVENKLKECRGKTGDICNYCILEKLGIKGNYIQAAFHAKDGNEAAWRLERRDTAPDSSYTHYYARAAKDKADANLIDQLDYIIRAFKAFYNGQNLPNELVWVPYDI